MTKQNIRETTFVDDFQVDSDSEDENEEKLDVRVKMMRRIIIKKRKKSKIVEEKELGESPIVYDVKIDPLDVLEKKIREQNISRKRKRKMENPNREKYLVRKIRQMQEELDEIRKAKKTKV